VTGNPRYWRFSCVGFVLECYLQGTGIQLLDWQSTAFPRVTLSELRSIYTDRNILAQKHCEELGLTGDGPWPIALPGYLFHCLQRDPEIVRRIPYLPLSSSEAHFPASPSHPTSTPAS
jgi:hypothetical protein